MRLTYMSAQVPYIHNYFNAACKLSKTYQVISKAIPTAMVSRRTHLQLNFRLSNILLTTTTRRNLLRFLNLVPHSLDAEILQRISLDRVDAQLATWLHDRKTARKEELFAAAGFFDDFDDAGLEFLDGGDVVC